MHLVFINLVTPKARAKHEILFNKPASGFDDYRAFSPMFFFWYCGFWAEVRNEESLIRLYSVRVGEDQWPVPLGERVEASGL
jgi:hypothetical protein